MSDEWKSLITDHSSFISPMVNVDQQTNVFCTLLESAPDDDSDGVGGCQGQFGEELQGSVAP